MKGYRPSFNDNIPNSYKNLIERCWQQELTFDEIFNLKMIVATSPIKLMKKNI